VDTPVEKLSGHQIVVRCTWHHHCLARNLSKPCKHAAQVLRAQASCHHFAPMEASGYCPSHSHHNMIARCNVQVGLVDLPVALLTMIFKVLKHPEFAALLRTCKGLEDAVHAAATSLKLGKGISPSCISSLSALPSLSCLSISFNDITSLPEAVGQLTQLAQLALDMCTQVTSLPGSISQLTALEQLSITFCFDLPQLPYSICQLAALTELSIRFAGSLEALPDSIGQLAALRKLHVPWNNKLRSLPASINLLTGLHELDVGGCTRLERLPDGLHKLSQLTYLSLSACRRLQELSDEIGELSVTAAVAGALLLHQAAGAA
jgi:hypothetical protein